MVFLLYETEPIWMTLIFIVIFFLAVIFYYMPKELEKRRKEDQAYADRKGWTLEQLHKHRKNARDRRIPKSLREYILKRDNYECQYCGSQTRLEIDHIFPFSRGGGNEPENLQVLCKSCNLEKGDSIPDIFKQKNL